LQRVEDAGDLGAAADQTEVAEVPGGERAERVEVVRVAARNDDDVRGRRQVDPTEPLGDVLDDDGGGHREPLRVGELLAIVDDVNAETGVGGGAREMPADVAAANDVERGSGGNRIDVHVHLAAADEAGF